MKTYKIILIILIALTVGLSGCFNLDEEVYSEVDKESFTPTEQDVVALLASAYFPFGFVMNWYGYFDNQEEPGDVIITPTRPNGWDDGGTYKRMHKHTWTSEQGQPETVYANCYDGINNANRVKDQIEAGELPMDEAGKAVTIAELRGIRAMWYAILLDSHGNVPIVTAFTDEIPTQSTRQEVYEFVVKELTEVIESNLLSKKADKETYGRVNQWTAYATLMRVYLNAEVYTGTPQWEKALECANAIIGSGLYELSADYSDNFKVDLDFSNKEVIFAVPYDDIYHSTYTFCQHAKWYPPKESKLHFGWAYQCWGGSCANPQFIDSYDPEDGRLDKTWLRGPMYALDNDEQLAWTCLNYLPSLSCKKDNKSMTSIDFGCRVNKYEQDIETSWYWSNDFAYYRYAEVLLTKAECLLRLSRDEDKAVQLVNEIRLRAPAPTVTLEDLKGDTKIKYGIVGWGSLTYEQYAAVNSGETTWEEIGVEGSQEITQSGDDTTPVEFGGLYDEWGWEFACEAQRRTQMIRFGTYSTKNWFNHEAVGDNHTQIFPIPLGALNTNSNLKQNPGYN